MVVRESFVLLGNILGGIEALIGGAGECAYWSARARGMSEGDIRGMLCLFSALYLCFAFNLVYPVPVPAPQPERWAQCTSFWLALPAIERAVLWLGRQGWVRTMKLGLQFAVIIGGLLLLYNAPSMHSQQQHGDAPTIWTVAKDHEDRLDQMERIQATQIEQIKQLLKFNENLMFWVVGIGMGVIVTFVGLTMTDMYKTFQVGKRERERDERLLARQARRAANQPPAEE